MSLLRSALVRLPCVYFYLIHCQSHIKIQYSIQLKVWLDTHAKFGSLLCWWELAERINTTGLCLFLECFLPIKMFCCSAQIHISGSDKHRTDIKELTASKADWPKSCTWTLDLRPTSAYILCLRQRKCFSAETQTVVLIKPHLLTPNFSNWKYKYGWSDWYFSDRLPFLFDPLPEQSEGSAQLPKTPPIRAVLCPTPTRATDAMTHQP